MMKTIAAAASLFSVSQAAAAVPASKVCVTNSGGYDLKWWFDDLITGITSPDSGAYPIDKTRCMDVAGSLYDLNQGDLIEVMVHAVAGVTKSADTAIFYQASPAVTQTFTCNGTTLNFTCILNGE